MADYVFRPVTDGDIEYLANNMRQQDMDEVYAATGSSQLAAILRQSVTESALLVSVEYDGRLLCIGGAASQSLLSCTGIPWMLGTNELSWHSALFVRHGKRCISELLTRFERLENHVDARNTKSVRWLRSIGFTVDDPQPYGAFGLPFRRFSAVRPCLKSDKLTMK